MSRKRPKTNSRENILAAAIDYKSAIDSIASPIRSILAQALQEGWSDTQLANHPKIQLLLTARAISTAILEPDAGKAMAAIKDLKDRTQGKPTEKVEVTSKLEKLPETQLDARLRTLLARDDEDEEQPGVDYPPDLN